MIRNLKDLEKLVNGYIVKALELTRDEIFDTLWNKVNDYYNEEVFNNDPANEPVVYERTFSLMNNLTASKIEQSGKSFSFTVGWDNDYLVFKYPGNSHWKHNIYATGRDVLEYMNDRSHGGTVGGSHAYIDEAMNEIDVKYGSISNLFILNCKKVGIPIK